MSLLSPPLSENNWWCMRHCKAVDSPCVVFQLTSDEASKGVCLWVCGCVWETMWMCLCALRKQWGCSATHAAFENNSRVHRNIRGWHAWDGCAEAARSLLWFRVKDEKQSMSSSKRRTKNTVCEVETKFFFSLSSRYSLPLDLSLSLLSLPYLYQLIVSLLHLTAKWDPEDALICFLSGEQAFTFTLKCKHPCAHIDTCITPCSVSASDKHSATSPWHTQQL